MTIAECRCAVVLEVNPSRLARGTRIGARSVAMPAISILLRTLVVNPFAATRRKQCLYPKSDAVGQAI